MFCSVTSYAALNPLHNAKNPFPADHNTNNADITIIDALLSKEIFP